MVLAGMDPVAILKGSESKTTRSSLLNPKHRPREEFT